MAMKSPAEYVERLRDGRELYINGRRIDDVTQSLEFDVPIAYAAADYHYDNNRDLRTYSTGNGSYGNRLCQIPRMKEELDTRIELLRNISIVSATVSGLFVLLHVKGHIVLVEKECADNTGR